MEWIKISNELPSIGSPIILTVADENGKRYVDIGYIDASNTIRVASQDVTNNVVAWMPLPEPYTS